MPSDTPPPIPSAGTLSLLLSHNSLWSPGFVTFDIPLTNDDGSEPTVVFDDPTIGEFTLGTHVAGTFPKFTGNKLTALKAGTANGTITVEGQATETFVLSVGYEGYEGAIIDSGTLQYTQPAPPPAPPASNTATQTAAS